MSTTAPAPLHRPETRQYAWVRHLMPRIVIGALIAAALVGVYAVLIGEFDELCWRLIGTISLFVFFSLVSWYDADVSARRAPWFGAVSVVTSVYLLIAGLVKVWTPNTYDGSSPWWEPFAWFALVAVARLGLLHIHLVLNTQRRFTGPLMSKVTIGTLTLVGLLTVGLSLPLIFTRVDFGETYWRLMGVIAILDALGTILIPLTFSLFGPKVAKPQQQFPRSRGSRRRRRSRAGSPRLRRRRLLPRRPLRPPPAPAPPTTRAGRARAPAPPSTAYPRLVVGSGLQLEWPRYINGAPLPARPDGSPDFTGVVGYA